MKKVILVFIVLCFTFLLAACGKTSNGKEYDVVFIVNGEENDKIKCNGKETITLPNAPTKSGYDFVGWYYEETFTTEFKVDSLASNPITDNINVYGKFSPTNYAINYTNVNGATNSNPANYNIESNTITLNDISKNGYIFNGWYDGDTEIITIPKGSTGNITLEARWTIDLTNNLYVRDENYVYFGEYPQTKVSDETIITSLTDLQGTLPTSINSQTWISYGYYQFNEINGIETNATNYMWYKDVTYNGEQYRGVYFTSYRSYDIQCSSSADYSYQDDNGYTTSNVYWFKFEPIKWRILKEANNKALLLCEMIIDSQDFYPYERNRIIEGVTIYTSNWEYSTIRSWLNDNFYNTAFSTLQKKLIVKQTLDNKTTSYKGSSNTYATCQNNTEDNIYLLSYQDMVNVDYGFIAYYTERDVVRQKKTTDYAQAQGAYTLTSTDDYLKIDYWRLRSTNSENSYYTFSVSCGGNIFSDDVGRTSSGVVPALTIKLN